MGRKYPFLPRGSKGTGSDPHQTSIPIVYAPSRQSHPDAPSARSEVDAARSSIDEYLYLVPFVLGTGMTTRNHLLFACSDTFGPMLCLLHPSHPRQIELADAGVPDLDKPVLARKSAASGAQASAARHFVVAVPPSDFLLSLQRRKEIPFPIRF